jgi:hypothetical protein
MKKFFTLCAAALLSVSIHVSAQDNNPTKETWFDIDFSSTEWLDAFTAVLGSDIRTLEEAGTYSINVVGPTVVNDFSFNGNLHSCKEYLSNAALNRASFLSVCGRTFAYDFRLRNNAGTNIEFPEMENAGKIYVYARNVNNENDRALNLQQKQPDETWATVTTFTIPKYVDYNLEDSQDILVTYEVNSATPVTLRLQRSEGNFINIFRIALEKFGDGSSVQTIDGKKMAVFVDAQTIRVESDLQEMTGVQVVDMLGNIVFKTKTLTKQISTPTLSAGIYIVKVAVAGEEMIKKVSIK